MTELEKLERAKTYLEKLANGINPLDDTVVPDGDMINQVRLSRCFFFYEKHTPYNDGNRGKQKYPSNRAGLEINP